MITGSDGKVRNTPESLANAKATKYVSTEYKDMKVTVIEQAIETAGLKRYQAAPINCGYATARELTSSVTASWKYF